MQEESEWLVDLGDSPPNQEITLNLELSIPEEPSHPYTSTQIHFYIKGYINCPLREI